MASMAAGRLQSCRRDPAKVGGLAELTFLPREGPGRPLKGMNLPMGSPKMTNTFFRSFFRVLMISYDFLFQVFLFFLGWGKCKLMLDFVEDECGK